jgi:hypothetical protein
MAKHKLIKPAAKEAGKPDLSKSMNVTELKTAVTWLFEYFNLGAVKK